MKIKKEYVILAVLIVGLSLYIVMRNPNRTHFQLPELPEITKADISKVELSRKDGAIILHKKDETWFISPQEYPVSAFQINNILEGIEGLTLMAMVSESKSYKLYDLDDEGKISVKAWAGEDLKREFEVGKTAEGHKQTFVKLGDDYRVYHAKGNLKNKFYQTHDSLRDKSVLSFDKGEIQELRISKGEHSVVLARKEVVVNEGSEESKPEDEGQSETKEVSVPDMVWVDAEGKEADGTKVNALLASLSNLRCQKYIDGQQKEDLGTPVYTFELGGAQVYFLSIFKTPDEKSKNYPATSSENDYPFTLPGWVAEKVMKSSDELLGIKPPEPKEEGEQDQGKTS